jgi:hypothetical protein
MPHYRATVQTDDQRFPPMKMNVPAEDEEAAAITAEEAYAQRYPDHGALRTTVALIRT